MFVWLATEGLSHVRSSAPAWFRLAGDNEPLFRCVEELSCLVEMPSVSLNRVHGCPVRIATLGTGSPNRWMPSLATSAGSRSPATASSMNLVRLNESGEGSLPGVPRSVVRGWIARPAVFVALCRNERHHDIESRGGGQAVQHRQGWRSFAGFVPGDDRGRGSGELGEQCLGESGPIAKIEDDVHSNLQLQRFGRGFKRSVPPALVHLCKFRREEVAVRSDDRRVARRVHNEDRSHHVGVRIPWLLCNTQCDLLCCLHDATGHTRRRRFGRISR
jgi:hypothetical protein